MSKFQTVYVCQQCGSSTPKWAGQCPQCKAWNSLVEETRETRHQKPVTSRSGKPGKVVRLEDLTLRKDRGQRIQTGSLELDRVLGGGIVPGSVVLVAGEPGIGKSTLLTQLSIKAGKKQGEVLYVCGEESPDQVALRVRRLAPDDGLRITDNSKNLALLAETDVDLIIEAARREKPTIMIVDSVQTLSSEDLSGMAGSVGQVRECTLRLMRLAKDEGVSVFLVGHVTKEGSVAGPKVLEHMVDVVLDLTGERAGRFRLLRTLKNRFGATDEVGVFEMGEGGLSDVTNPSGAFLEESQAGKPGSSVVVVMEGTRPVLVEVQALAVKSFLPVPRRVAQGVALAKVQLICAVLEKYCRVNLSSYDVFVSVAGGVKIIEPAADLGIALAIAIQCQKHGFTTEISLCRRGWTVGGNQAGFGFVQAGKGS